MNGAPPLRHGFLRVARATLLAAFPLYLAHPFILHAAARAALARYWGPDFDLGAVRLSADGALLASSLVLRHPGADGAAETFAAAQGLRVDWTLRVEAGGHLRPAPVALSCDRLVLNITRDGVRYAARPRAARADGRATRPPPSQSVRISVADGTVRVDPPEDFSVRNAAARGLFVFDAPARRFRLELAGDGPRFSGGLLHCEGSFATHEATWTFSAARVAVDPALASDLPDVLRPIWARLAPAGEVRLAGTIRNAPGRPPDVAITTEALETSLRLPPPFPLPLSGLRGTAYWRNGTLDVPEATGFFRGSPVRLAGRLGDREGKSSISFDGRGMLLDDALRTCLPPRLARTWDFLKPRGALDLAAAVSWRGGADSVSAALTANLQGVALEGLATRPSDIAGQIAIEFLQTGGAAMGEGEARLDTLRLGPVLLDHVRIPLSLGVAGGAPALDLGTAEAPLEAGCAGGVVTGSARLTSDPAPALSLSAAGHDVRLDRLIPMMSPTASPVSGRLEFTVALARDAGRISGEGTFKVKDAELGRLPTLTGLLERLLGADKIAKERVRGAYGSFRIHPHKVTLSDLRMNGKNVALYATEGTIRYGGEIDFTFYVGTRDEFIRNVPILPDVWRLATSVFTGLASVRVTGTVREPTFEIAPLRAPVQSVVNILEGLVGEEK